MSSSRKKTKSRKGTEKPIEIFIALFIILAVSLLVLRLFQGQIDRTTGQLGGEQLEQELQANKNRFVQSCNNACTDAVSRGCTAEALVRLCTLNSAQVLGAERALDLDNNQVIGYNTLSYGGIGVCEQNIPCFMEHATCCNRRINLESCREILCNYWDGRGIDITGDLTAQFEAVGYTNSSFNACDEEDDDLAFWSGFVPSCN